MFGQVEWADASGQVRRKDTATKDEHRAVCRAIRRRGGRLIRTRRFG